jgi:hypothetical protein
MATLARKNTYFAVKKETTQGTIVNPTGADFILIDDDFSTETSYEEIERAVINGNLDPLASLLGMQNGSATVTVELKGSGTAHTAPECDAILRACFDDPVDALSGGNKTVASSLAANLFTVGGSPGIAIGQAISISVTGSAAEYAIVVGASGTTTQTLQVEPAFSVPPQAGDVVISGITYKQKQTGQDTLSVHFFMDCDGQDGLWVKFGGCRPNMTLTNASTGQIPKMQFSFTPTNWSVQHTGSNLATLAITPTIDTETNPPVCLGATLTLGETRTLVHTQNLEMDLRLEVTKRMSMIPVGGVRSSRFTKRGVNGKFDLDLEDDSEYTNWTAQTDSLLLVKFGSTAGNIPVIIIPDLRRSQVAPTDSDGLWIYDITWKANARSSTIGPVFLAFF